jgi:hypothetical protein
LSNVIVTGNATSLNVSTVFNTVNANVTRILTANVATITNATVTNASITTATITTGNITSANITTLTGAANTAIYSAISSSDATAIAYAIALG